MTTSLDKPKRTALDRSSAIWELQARLLQMPQIAVRTEHFFANGMYARQFFLPKGALVVGRVHTQEHFIMCTLGRMVISSGEDRYEMQAGDVRVSPPGTKRAVLGLDDTVLVTVHRVSQSDDLAAVEAEISEADPSSPYGTGNTLKEAV